MLKIKKISTIVLALCISLTSIMVFDRGNSYAAEFNYNNYLKNNKTYYCDLDGDGRKEKIKQVENYDQDTYLWNVKLYINGKLKKAYQNIRGISVYICDFNKYDGRKEIYVHHSAPMGGASPLAYICRYNKNGTFKNYKLSGYVKSYNNKTGVIKFSYAQSDENPNFKSFTKPLGDYLIIDYTYKKITKSSFSDIVQKTATATIVAGSVYYEHIPLKTLTAYTSTSGKKVAYKLYKGEEVYFVSLYKSGSKKYVKVKNANGKYGWVKVGNTKLFE